MKSTDPELRDVPGYEGLYAATRDGRIWSYSKTKTGQTVPLHNGKFLKGGMSKQGYRRVLLYKANSFKGHSVHRLIAITYIPNPYGKAQVNHKNGDKDNNSVENLEWNSASENIKHAFSTGLKKTILKHDDKCHCYRCHPENRFYSSTYNAKGLS